MLRHMMIHPAGPADQVPLPVPDVFIVSCTENVPLTIPLPPDLTSMLPSTWSATYTMGTTVVTSAFERVALPTPFAQSNVPRIVPATPPVVSVRGSRNPPVIVADVLLVAVKRKVMVPEMGALSTETEVPGLCVPR